MFDIEEDTMQRMLPLTNEEEKAMQELDAFLKSRIEAAEHGEVVGTPVNLLVQLKERL